MTQHTEQVPENGVAENATVRKETWPDRSEDETTEIKGWALRWDTTALRKVNMARKMRSLRQTEADR